MKPSVAGGAIAIVLLIALVVAYSTFFTVYQTRQALVVRLGESVRVIAEPGLNAKIPFIDNVIYIDKHILNIECVIASASPSSNWSAATVAWFRAPLGRPSGLPLCPGLKVI
jgi:regulator of protease activity HflC (stomatin/prohibitin superfamily)